MLKYIVLVVLAVIVGVGVYVRLAPSDVAVWGDPKLPVMGPGEYPGAGSHTVQRPLPDDGRATLARLDEIIRATPRTQVLTGSVEAGKLTYITRSRAFGFPDYTTVTLTPLAATGTSTLQIFGRLRFGQSDLGVNRARIEGWLAALDA